MADFFTLIGLVMGVSGGAYSAIASLHGHYDGYIHGWLTKSNNCHVTVTERGCDTAKKAGGRAWHSFNWWHRIWTTSNAVPTIAFCIFTFGAATHVCLNHYWFQVATPMPAVDETYMAALTAIVVLDFLSICATGVALGCLKYRSSQLDGESTRAIEYSLQLASSGDSDSGISPPVALAGPHHQAFKVEAAEIA